MMRCDRSQNLFARAWDDELTVSEREALEAHWGACGSCRRSYDEYARTLELVQTLPRPTVSADFAARVLSEARRREAETSVASRLGRTGWAFGLAPRPAMALAAAFAVVCGLGGIALFAPRGGSPTAPTVASNLESPAPAPAPVPTSSATSTPTTVAEEPRRVAAVPRSASREPIPRPAASTAREFSAPAEVAVELAADAPAVPDSLFDHTADVELVLDPVQLRRERGMIHGLVGPRERRAQRQAGHDCQRQERSRHGILLSRTIAALQVPSGRPAFPCLRLSTTHARPPFPAHSRASWRERIR